MITLSTRRVTRDFSGQKNFLGIRTLDTFHLQHMKERSRMGQIGFFFFRKLSKSFFKWEISPKMTTMRVFFPKLGHFFPIYEEGQGRPPPSRSSPAPENERIIFSKTKFWNINGVNILLSCIQHKRLCLDHRLKAHAS